MAPLSFSGSTSFSFFSGNGNLSGAIGLTCLLSSLFSSILRLFLAACCCSRIGRFLGDEILPFGGNLGRGNLCFCGKSSSSISGLPWFAASLVAKKSCTSPI